MSETQGYRLSPQQRRIWQLQRLAGRPFLARCTVALRGDLRPEALSAALAEVAARIEILRTTFSAPAAAEIPLQHIGDGMPSWQEIPAEWDLKSGPLVHAALSRLAEAEQRLSITMPALLGDAVSLDLLVREIAAAYATRPDGESAAEPEIQYADIAGWQNELLEGEETAEGQSYWKEIRLTRTPPAQVPGGRARSGRATRSPRQVDVGIDGALAARIAERSQEIGVLPGSFLWAAWQSLLWRADGEERALVGVGFDGRSYEGLETAFGPLARFVPVAARVEPGIAFRDLALRAEESLADAHGWQEFFDWESFAPYLPVGFEVVSWPEPVPAGGVDFEVLQLEAEVDRFDLLLRARQGHGGLAADLRYDEEVLAPGQAERVAGQLQALLRAAVERPETPVAELEILTPPERHWLLRELGGTAARPAGERCVHELFEEQVRRTPGRTAVAGAGRRLTYAELGAASQRLAHRLRRMGVGPEVCVALALERSVDLIVAMLGALRAGGAYVPLEPSLPAERLAFMLEDTRAAVLITEDRLLPSLPPGRAKVLTLDGDAIAAGTGEETADTAPGNLAYVLFTSGSTGQPKGVGVAHRQLVHYLENVQASLDLPPGASFAMVSTPAADLGNTAIFPTLCSGGCLHLLTAEQATDPRAFQDYLAEHEIDCLKIVPSHLRALQGTDEPRRALPRQRLVIGGEASSPQWLAELAALAPGCRIYNHYGPTETTVGVLAGRLDLGPGEAPESVPLGRPIGDTRFYVADPEQRLVPAGFRGELLIGGSGVARGYFGRPAETAARFIPDPFGDVPGERLYRTGDLMRLRPDGQVEFLGRTDSQVKVRGFRVELGEIEAALRRHPGVREAVAGLRADEAGNQRLVAWLVCRPDMPPGDDELRAALLARLPEPMIPAAYVRLEVLPVTPNGKIDRKALPDPPAERRRAELVPPRTPVERALVEIFQEVLRLAPVGIHDNFFQVGGDSILSIQVVARAGRRGLRLTAQQIFENQTIAALAPLVQATGELEAEQGAVTGPVPLTPIQSRFLGQGRADPHHYNQAVLLTLLQPLRPAVLERAVSALLRHHDALRLRFEETQAGWRQTCAEPDEAVPLLRLDLSSLPSGAAQERAWEAAAGDLQAGCDLAQGPLLRLLRGDLGAAARLLIVAHHLVVDGVSWRILLEDLERACLQIERGEAPALPPKTTSYRGWAERLQKLASSPALQAEAPFWRAAVEPPPERLPVDKDGGPDRGRNREASARTVRASLDVATTRALLQEAHAAYRTRINDLLLTALLQAFARWTGEPELLVDLEGHGREDALFPGVDLSRTVGWLTAIYPVRLRLANAADPARSLKTVKEQLRGVPRGGIGHGVLSELGAGETSERLRAAAGPQVVFNYLGQFDQAVGESRLFSPGAAATGPQRSSRSQRRYLLDVTAQVSEERLHIDCTYSDDVHHRATIERLATDFRDALQRLVAHCASPEAGGYTPSDFPLARLDQRQLDRLLGNGSQRIEDVYPLSPMQQSLLFYALHNPGSAVGVEQTSFTLVGEIDRGLFRRAWQGVVGRHPILRSEFVWEGVREALQVVHHEVALPFREEDWTGRPAAEQERLLGELLEEERSRGFDPRRPPLMRLALVRLAGAAWRYVSTRHHLILDGWSGMLLLREAFAAYEAMRAGAEPPWEPVQPYRRYIAWLQEQDMAQAEAFWRNRLQGFTAPTPLPTVPSSGAASGAGAPEAAAASLTLPATATLDLERLARENRLTLNILVQGAWALLLSRWSGRLDVVFGSTVSGRPAELAGVEAIVGLFINNLPVRARVEPGRPAIAWLQDLQKQMIEAAAYEHTPPERVQEWSEVPRVQRLFDTLCVFENYPAGDPGEWAASSLTMADLRAPVKTSYLLTLVAVPGPELRLTLVYDRRRFAAAAAQRLLDDLGSLLSSLPGSAGRPLSVLLEVLSEPPSLPEVPAMIPAALGGRGEPVSPDDPLETALAGIFEEILDLRPIGRTDDFFDLGGSSMLALSLMRRIQERLGRHLPLPSLVGGATVQRLAATLRGQAAGWDLRALVALQPEGERAPFFCVHSAGGMVLNLIELARALGDDQPVYALQDPAFFRGEPETASVEELAASYLAEIRPVQPAGPYRLGGHSFGGVVAFEMAQQLRAAGEEVDLVALIDTGAPGRAAPPLDDTRVLVHISEVLGRFYGRPLDVSAAELEVLAPEERSARVLDELRKLPGQLGADPRHFASFFDLYKRHVAASRLYRSRRYDGRLVLFRASDPGGGGELEDASQRADRSMGWDGLADRRVEVIDVPGDHTTMLSQPQVAHLGARLRRCLDKGGEPSPSMTMTSEGHELRPQG